jgi:transcriptional regulator of acetoin/glycerol metabolism
VAPGILPETAADLSRAHFEGYMRTAEKAYFMRALVLCKGDSTDTARRIGIGRSTVYLKLRQLGLLKKMRKKPSTLPPAVLERMKNASQRL